MPVAPKTWMAGTSPAMTREKAVVRSSLRAKRSNPSLRVGIDGLLRRFAPVRKRFAFVAGNDDGGSPTTAEGSAPLAPKPLGEHLFQNLPLDVLVGHRGIVPPPAVTLHLPGCRDKAIGHFSEIRIRVVEAEDQPAGADPAQRQPFGAEIVLKHPVVAGRFGVLHHPDRGEIADA